LLPTLPCFSVSVIQLAAFALDIRLSVPGLYPSSENSTNPYHTLACCAKSHTKVEP